ncbi:MAG: hypothetical protein PHI36_05865 [Bacteroidales bacterium]|nr:hypothetical protein [Bacteroidales bacterium]
MKKIILLVIGFIFFSSCFSQEQKEIDKKQILVFDTVVLDTLLCIEYSDVTFGEYNKIIDYNLEGKTELTEENVKKMFLGNKKVIEIRNYHTDEVVDTITSEKYLENRTFYLQNIVQSNKKWTALIIEEIENDFWDKSSDKYLVTIDKKQNLISKYRIAYYGRFGTYTCCDEDENGNIIQYEDEDEYGNVIMRDMCGRCPWYTGDSGCLNKDLTIRLEGRTNNQAFIDKKGNIIMVK